MKPIEQGAGKSRARVVVENVRPTVEQGRFCVKHIVGDVVTVTADVFADGHDHVVAELLLTTPTGKDVVLLKMLAGYNDHWSVTFSLLEVGEYRFKVRGFIDSFSTWRSQLKKRLAAEQEVSVDLEIGAELVQRASLRSTGRTATDLLGFASQLKKGVVEVAFSEVLADLMDRCPNRMDAGEASFESRIWADRDKARFSTWYEVFPRSCSTTVGQTGRLKDLEDRLPTIARMGFDVVYLPPIHPIGDQFRKGKNNALVATAAEPGSPWAVGNEAGGHDAIHPDLGDLVDFDRLVAAANRLGLELAMDFAVQCSPDHPYVKQHPEWFRSRPDGTIQYAENPPKKYQDIYPVDFDSPAFSEIWDELKRVVEFWVLRGVKIFRVDNPHTKPFSFWEWLIEKIHASHPDVLFLAEAFTRPKIMYRLAKLGFSQSYTYYTWRITKSELIEYMTELTQSPVADFFRPNFWPNTPDILHEFLQGGGRPAFALRYVLAATLCSSIGIYGPAYEHCIAEPREPGSEEYKDSEKYEAVVWDWEENSTLRPLISRMNAVRRAEPALQRNDTLQFHPAEHEDVLCYSKSAGDAGTIITVLNLSPTSANWAIVELALQELGIDPMRPYQMHDLIDGRVYEWHGKRNMVLLDPSVRPAHVFRIQQT